MKQKLFLPVLLCLAMAAQAQSGLTIKSSTSLYIAPATIFSIDSLALVPSAAFTLSGISLVRTNTVSYATQNSYVKRVYRWSGTTPAFTGMVTILYRENELNGIAESGLTLNTNSGGGWSASVPVLRSPADNLVSTSLSGVALRELALSGAFSTLPVRWISAEARNENGYNVVRWITADETNAKDYQVQRSTDGANWQNFLTTLPARNLQGPNNYWLTDPHPPAPLTWYRIRQNDLDGEYSYSATMMVQVNTPMPVKVHPNPIGAAFTITSGRRPMQSVQVYNMSGALIQVLAVNRGTQYTVNSSSWAAGGYRIVVTLSDGGVVSQTVVK